MSAWPSPSPIKPNPDRNGPIHTECKKSTMLCPLHLKLKHVAPSTTGKQLLACEKP